MECVFDKCNVSDLSERFITCWLCDNNVHLKCAGFNGRHFDKFADTSNGIRWSCHNCRKLDIDFCRLYKDTRKSILDLNNDLSSFMSKFKLLENMFLNFKWPESTIASPITKRKKPSSSPNIASSLNPIITESRDLLGFLSPINRNHPAITPSLVPEKMVVNTKDSIEKCNPSGPPAPNKPIATNSSNLSLTIHPPPVHSPTAISLPSTSTNGSCDLVVVPPRKTIFISRLACSTSEENIRSYILSKCSEFNDNDCTIFKFNYTTPRDISSFKIIVPHHIFEVIVNENFWPCGVLVKEFIPRERHRRNNGVDIHPSQIQSASKN